MPEHSILVGTVFVVVRAKPLGNASFVCFLNRAQQLVNVVFTSQRGEVLLGQTAAVTSVFEFLDSNDLMRFSVQR
jgi:hypothetical protein